MTNEETQNITSTKKEEVKQSSGNSYTHKKHTKVRRFEPKLISIPTIGGHPLKVWGWSTNEPIRNQALVKKGYVCSVCEKDFNEKRKLTAHMRYHKTPANNSEYSEQTQTETENE